MQTDNPDAILGGRWGQPLERRQRLCPRRHQHCTDQAIGISNNVQNIYRASGTIGNKQPQGSMPYHSGHSTVGQAGYCTTSDPLLTAAIFCRPATFNRMSREASSPEPSVEKKVPFLAQRFPSLRSSERGPKAARSCSEMKSRNRLPSEYGNGKASSLYCRLVANANAHIAVPFVVVLSN